MHMAHEVHIRPRGLSPGRAADDDSPRRDVPPPLATGLRPARGRCARCFTARFLHGGLFFFFFQELDARFRLDLRDNFPCGFVEEHVLDPGVDARPIAPEQEQSGGDGECRRGPGQPA